MGILTRELRRLVTPLMQRMYGIDVPICDRGSEWERYDGDVVWRTGRVTEPTIMFLRVTASREKITDAGVGRL